jgi:hypothetical protein
METALFYALGALVNALVVTILGFIIYFKNRREAANRMFALFCADVALWSYAYFVWFLLKDKNLVLLNHRVFLMGAAIFIAILFFHAILTFTNKTQQYKKYLIAGYIIFSFFLAASIFTPFIVKDVQPMLFFEFWPMAGILLAPFLVAWFFYIAFTIYILIKELKEQNITGDYKVQLICILVGAIIGFGGAATNYFLWYNIMIPPFSNFLIALGVAIIAYGILRHHLFSVKVLISELLVFAMWIFAIIRTALSGDIQEMWLNGALAVILFAVGILLMRSISKEVEMDKKELEQTKRELDLEQRLRKTFAELSEEKIKRIEEVVFNKNRK